MKRKAGKKIGMSICAILLVASMSAALVGCGSSNDYDPLEGVETQEFVDSAGRTVTMPQEITRVAPSGAVAEIVLLPIASDYLVGLASSPSTTQEKFFPENLRRLPTFGQFYGSKSTLNMEALIEAQPQLIIDSGDEKLTIATDMNTIQNQTGIPTIYLNGELEYLADTYRTLGQLLGEEERGEEIADFIDRTIEMAKENSAKIPDDQRYRVMYGTGTSSLACNASGSSQADVIDIIGCVNAVQVGITEQTDKGGGTLLNMEEVYSIDPDVILFARGGQYDNVTSNEWSELTAVQNDMYFEVPNTPYSWMSSPPSVNRILGIWWLGNLLYPDIYDYDMVEVAQEYYQLFWNYDLSREEAEELLSNSTLK